MPSIQSALQHPRQALVIAATIALVGCGNLNSIHRTLDTNGGKGVLIDAKQRAIIVGERVDKDGDQVDRLRHVACAEPSPDALSAYAAQFAGELGLSPIGGADGTNRSLAIKTALQEAAASIGMRTPSIQLLRDAMYRVCEAYANGAVDNDQYELLMRRYQRQIVAMMAIEQLTQVNRAPPISLTTAGSVGGERPLSEWTDEIKRQQDLLAKQQDAIAMADKAIQEAEAALAKNSKDTAAAKKKDDAQKAKTAAQTASAQIKSTITSLQDHMAGGTSLAGHSAAEVASTVTATTAEHIKEVAPYVVSIASLVLDVDDTPALCFAYYKREDHKNLSNALKRMCDARMKLMETESTRRTEALNACTASAVKAGNKQTECLDHFAADPSTRMLKKQHEASGDVIKGLSEELNSPSGGQQPTGKTPASNRPNKHP